MARFKRLTVEEARSLSRDELLPRIEEEQKYWYHLIDRGIMRSGDDEAFKTFTQIMHAAFAPGTSTLHEDDWKKPLGELGQL